MYKHGASIKEDSEECEEEGGKGEEEHEECEEAACGAEEEGDEAGSLKGKHVLCVCVCVWKAISAVAIVIGGITAKMVRNCGKEMWVLCKVQM